MQRLSGGWERVPKNQFTTSDCYNAKCRGKALLSPGVLRMYLLIPGLCHSRIPVLHCLTGIYTQISHTTIRYDQRGMMRRYIITRSDGNV